MTRPDFITPFYGDGTSSTYTVRYCLCNTHPCTCRNYPPIVASGEETPEEKAKRIVVALILGLQFFPKDKEHLEKAIQIVKEGL